jgi:hypothetical protein
MRSTTTVVAMSSSAGSKPEDLKIERDGFCKQAIALKFRLLSTAFTSARLVNECSRDTSPIIWLSRHSPLRYSAAGDYTQNPPRFGLGSLGRRIWCGREITPNYQGTTCCQYRDKLRKCSPDCTDRAEMEESLAKTPSSLYRYIVACR